MDAVAFFEVGLSFLRLLKLRHDINYKKKHFRRWWVKPHIQTCIRNDYGAFSTLFCYFKMHDHEEFYKLYRMSVPQFDKLYEILKTKLERSSAVREPLPPQLRFAITLHFLAHGDSIETLCKLYYIGKSTVYGILSDVCQDIWDILSPVYLPEKSVDDWKEIAIDYEKKCNFPHCLGSIDGKHIRITKPPNSGSAFFNYKKYYSFVLMAICDAHYRFTWIDVGDYGSLNDASVFGATGLAQELEEKRLPLPEPECLPGTQSSIPYFLIGDEAFKLRPYMMRPYPRRLVTTSREELFNYWTVSNFNFASSNAFAHPDDVNNGEEETDNENNGLLREQKICPESPNCDELPECVQRLSNNGEYALNGYEKIIISAFRKIRPENIRNMFEKMMNLLEEDEEI
ncbi:protein ALP1-like isoform X2 [Leptopilina heterotoma]|uniref:protein ALP1-like isoform X2 n=1 Tax=Leptopilina heterotoma TaxID=63436 RepID=UPI001CA82773|nr:protein ALP1-like isoform X2 [Leptopilina heterotoma]